MNIRKFLNRPSKAQSALLEKEKQELQAIAAKEAERIRASSDEYMKIANTRCPHCGKSDIIDKIARVQGSGSVDGSFIFGSGSLFGSSAVDTSAVNHCVACGHEWVKGGYSNYRAEHEYADWYWTISRKINPNKKQYESDVKTWEMLEKYHAETICTVLHEGISYCDLTLKTARAHFKSIFDK